MTLLTDARWQSGSVTLRRPVPIAISTPLLKQLINAARPAVHDQDSRRTLLAASLAGARVKDMQKPVLCLKAFHSSPLSRLCCTTKNVSTCSKSVPAAVHTINYEVSNLMRPFVCADRSIMRRPVHLHQKVEVDPRTFCLRARELLIQIPQLLTRHCGAHRYHPATQP